MVVLSLLQMAISVPSQEIRTKHFNYFTQKCAIFLNISKKIFPSIKNYSWE